MGNKKENAFCTNYFRHFHAPIFSTKFCKINRIEAKKDKIAPKETEIARHKSFCSKKEFASRPNQMAPTKNVIDEINSPTDLPFLFILKTHFIISGQTHHTLNHQADLDPPD